MFTPIKNKKVYQHVIEQIQNMILKGELKKGDKLPSERELAEQLGVSRASIREAIRSLAIIGLIESRQGEGNFIRGDIKNNFFEPLSVMFMLNKGDSKDILDLRMIMEVEAAALAAKRIKDKEAKELNDLFTRLNDAEDIADQARMDKELHYKIAKITGNELIVNLLNSISSLIESCIKNAREKILEEKERRGILIQQHEKICNAIIKKDPEKASKAMREHLETVIDFMVDL